MAFGEKTQHLVLALLQYSDVDSKYDLGPNRIENEYALRSFPWVGPALRDLDLSGNNWLATHHAYGLLGAANATRAAIGKAPCS